VSEASSSAAPVNTGRQDFSNSRRDDGPSHQQSGLTGTQTAFEESRRITNHSPRVPFRTTLIRTTLTRDSPICPQTPFGKP